MLATQLTRPHRSIPTLAKQTSGCSKVQLNLRLRIIAERLCPSDGGPRPRRCAGGRRRGLSTTLVIVTLYDHSYGPVDIYKVGRMKVCR